MTTIFESFRESQSERREGRLFRDSARKSSNSSSHAAESSEAKQLGGATCQLISTLSNFKSELADDAASSARTAQHAAGTNPGTESGARAVAATEPGDSHAESAICSTVAAKFTSADG